MDFALSTLVADTLNMVQQRDIIRDTVEQTVPDVQSATDTPSLTVPKDTFLLNTEV